MVYSVLTGRNRSNLVCGLAGGSERCAASHTVQPVYSLSAGETMLWMAVNRFGIPLGLSSQRSHHSIMQQSNVIQCLGCRAAVDVQYPVCAGCGRCLFCGRQRGEQVSHCPICDVPYCKCCGRCAGCGSVRHSEIVEPCVCGISDDPVQRQAFVEKERPRRLDERCWWRFW